MVIRVPARRGVVQRSVSLRLMVWLSLMAGLALELGPICHGQDLGSPLPVPVVLPPLATIGSAPAHRVLEQPGRVNSDRGSFQRNLPGRVTPFGESQGGLGHEKVLPRPPQSSLLQRLQPQPATIPDAEQQPVWKTPYAYGYFGASGKRHWTRHHGYRENDKRWTLR